MKNIFQYYLTLPYTYQLYKKATELPANWNELAQNNVFLSTEYLSILELSAPKNMTCFFIGIYSDQQLVGILLSQHLDLKQLNSFGSRDRHLKKVVRNFIFKNFASQVLVIGNNMLTGQNAFSITNEIENSAIAQLLKEVVKTVQVALQEQRKKIQIITFKDFDANDKLKFKKENLQDYYEFSTQPNMIFKITEHWHSNQEYIDALSKKYRDQYKRARKKSDGIVKRKMNLGEVIYYEQEINALYLTVAKNAPFNTFFLSENHFRIFKEKLKDNFLFYGYFDKEKLIGFNTLIKNGSTMDTYFLGYDETIQREKMVYLNMLYDMIAYSINKGFKEIVFARTALEIKSSVGAKPVKMYGYIKHSNPFINRFMSKIFPFLEPETIWQERNPFK